MIMIDFNWRQFSLKDGEKEQRLVGKKTFENFHDFVSESREIFSNTFGHYKVRK